MADPPKCRVCGKSEWRHTCLGLSREDRRERAKAVIATMAARGLPIVEAPTLPPPATPSKEEAGFDKKAYQREYMRKRRKRAT